MVCEWIRKLKFPVGYASNLSRCVDVRNASLHNPKSHDCRVFIQRLLPLPLRDLLPTNVWNVLSLANFFEIYVSASCMLMT